LRTGITLWDSVHDADLKSVRSDLLERSLTLAFEVPYLLEGVTFALVLQGVQSVRALRFAIWPGEFSLPSALSWEEHQQRMEEYRKLWRQESESWTALESAVNSPDGAEITDGYMVSGNGVVTLRLGIEMPDGEWYEIFARAEHLRLTRSDYQQITLSQFLSLGHEYWEKFARRASETKR